MYDVVLNIGVLSSSMEFMILDKTLGTLVSVNKMVGEVGFFPRLESNRLCRIISLVVEDAAKYSALVVLLAQLVCLREAQRAGP